MHSPVSTLYSVYQLGPPAPSTNRERIFPSADRKRSRYPGGTTTFGIMVASKLDSSKTMMICGGAWRVSQLAAPPGCRRSGVDGSASSTPLVRRSTRGVLEADPSTPDRLQY